MGILVCADCGTDLVPVLPLEEEKPDEPQDNIVTVYQTRDQSLLPLIKSMLEEAGIEYVAQGELPMTHLAVGWVKIQVNEKDESQALAIIESINSPPPMGLEEEHGEPEDSQ